LLIATAIILFSYINSSTAVDPSITTEKIVTKTGTDTAKVYIETTGVGTVQYPSADVVFSIDSSGSMAATDPTGLTKTASKNFVDQMDSAKDQAGVVSWDDDVDFVQPLTNDFTLVKSRIDSIDASGGTELDAGLIAANGLLDSGGRSGVSHVIIFLTDGDGFYVPHNLPGSQADYALSKGYKIYTIGLGTAASEWKLQEIATVTGGKYYFAQDATVLQSIFQQIFQEIFPPTNIAGNNVVVTDVLPSYIQLLGNPSTPFTSKTVNPDGTTTLTWNIGTLLIGQTWTTFFNIRSTANGNVLTNVYPDSKLTYADIHGNTQTMTYPLTKAAFNIPYNPPGPFIIPGRPPKTVKTDNRAVANAKKVPLQSTGAPIAPLILGLLAIFVGIYPKNK
jgi:Ca-activated chloride channel homolog